MSMSLRLSPGKISLVPARRQNRRSVCHPCKARPERFRKSTASGKDDAGNMYQHPISISDTDGSRFVTVVSIGGSLTGSDVTSDEIIAFALPRR